MKKNNSFKRKIVLFVATSVILVAGLVTYLYATYAVWGYCTGYPKSGVIVEVWTYGMSSPYADVTSADGSYSIGIESKWANRYFSFYAHTLDEKYIYNWNFYWNGTSSIRHDFQLAHIQE